MYERRVEQCEGLHANSADAESRLGVACDNHRMSDPRLPPLMDTFPASPDRQVTLSNWRIAPFNRWGLHHMREVVPTAVVQRDPDRVWQLPVALRPGLGDVEFTTSDGTRRTVDGWLDESYADGLIVLKDGVIVHEQYAGHLTPATNHLLFSVTKSVTGLLTGLVVERCGLDPDMLVGDLIPEVSDSGYADCTVRNVLDMTVCLDFDEVYDDTYEPMRNYREASGWLPPTDPARPRDMRSFLAGLGRRSGEHGRRFRYLSPNSDMLGWICERAAGRSAASMLGEWMWTPMGAQCSADLAVDRLGAPRTAGGLAATLRDMARLTEMVRCGGIADGRQVIPAWWIDDILTKGDPAAWRGNEFESMLPDGGNYRSKWYVRDVRGTQAMGVGIHGQWIWFDRARGVSVVKLSSRPLASDLVADEAEPACYAALAAAV
jgi:CubicO group peptidase (beta-lactamase class C family)